MVDDFVRPFYVYFIRKVLFGPGNRPLGLFPVLCLFLIESVARTKGGAAAGNLLLWVLCVTFWACLSQIWPPCGLDIVCHCTLHHCYIGIGHLPVY